MLSGKRKYVLIILIFPLLAAGYWFLYSSQWGIAISNDHSWSYTFQDKEVKSFENAKWETSKNSIEINPENKEKNIVFQSEITISSPFKIIECAIEYDHKYSTKIYINHVECLDINRNLITGTSDDQGIRIEEYWRPRQVKIDQKTLRGVLKKGTNLISIEVYNVEDHSKINTRKKQVSFKTRGRETNFEVQVDVKKPKSYFQNSSIPIFNINTNSQVIPDEPKIDASLNIVDNKNRINNWNDSSTSYNIKIERRGFTSQTFAKKSYSIKLYDTNSRNISSSLLTLPKSKKWVLYGPYADKSLIRNALTYNLYKKMGNYSPSTKFVELIINDNYQGIYLLIEKIQLSPDHLNITELKINPNDSSQAKGGYLLEIDRNPWRSAFPPSGDPSSIPVSYMVNSPKKNLLNPVIENKIKSQFNTFEQHLYEGDNIYDYLDLNSFVDYLIITEFTKNIDGYCLSTFLYNKDFNAVKPKFFLGPIWDYNFSLGLTDYREGYNPEGYVYNATKHIPFWWKKLLQNDTFKTAYKKRYFELRKTVLSDQNIVSTVDSLVRELGDSPKSNFEKWTVLNTTDFWPNYFLGKTYDEEINYLKNWIKLRIEFLDKDILKHGNRRAHYYELSIRNDAEWLKKIEAKAKKRNISFEEMIKIDAQYMADQ